MSSAASPALETCREHRQADDARAAVEVAVTVVPLLLSWALAFWLAGSRPLWALVVDVVVVTPLLVRVFVLQHDAGHGALFSTRAKNELFGTLACMPLLVPYLEWRKSHAVHHRISSQLDHRIWPDIYTVTAAEYRAFTHWKKLGYRVFRHPVVMFGIAPAWYFFISCRFKGSMCEGLPRGKNLVNVLLTTTVAAALFGGLGHVFGWQRMLWVFLPTQLLAGSIGFWLFYVQHQTEDTWWATDRDWNYERAGLQGASFFDLPRPLAWATAWIGYHHVHHLDPRVPCYRLKDAHEALVARGQFSGPRTSFIDGVQATRLALWDEERQRLVPFS